MQIQTKKFAGLTGNQLKLLALFAMTCDHVGLQLLPQFIILRIIGRLAAPLFAYMIAEGCRYTHDRGRYLGETSGHGRAVPDRLFCRHALTLPVHFRDLFPLRLSDIRTG